jgi:LacI family transcriptional regulator
MAGTALRSPKRASVHTVARRARVSVATVSRVINRRADVDQKLRERVLAASRELGFVPKTQRQTIAIALGRFQPFSTASYVTSMLGALVKDLAMHDYLAEVVDMENLNPVREAHVEAVLGIVFDERITSLQNIPNLPILTVNAPLLESGVHSVATDHFQQGVIATEHFLAHGHRRIAFFETEADNWASRQRMAGHAHAMRAAGLAVDPNLVAYSLNQPLYESLASIVHRGATALLNFGDDAGLEAVYVLTEVMRLSIPKDISIISVEYGPPHFRYMSPPHTVVSQPMEELARVAVEKLMEVCCRERESSNELINITLPCQLIERKSVARVNPSH